MGGKIVMLNLVGGYGSNDFWLLVIGLLLSGSILNAFHNIILKVIGSGLFIYGGVLCLGMINYTIDTTPNPPSCANYFPLLFALILLLVVFKKMVAFGDNGKRTNPQTPNTSDTDTHLDIKTDKTGEDKER